VKVKHDWTKSFMNLNNDKEISIESWLP